MRVTATNIPVFRDYANNGRVVVFDTETTGCTVHDEICQIAAAEYVNGEQTRTLTLEELRKAQVDMFTTVIIGNSSTLLRFGRMLTPRGYAL